MKVHEMKQSRYLVRQLTLAWFAAGLALFAVDVRPGVGQEPTRLAYHATYDSTLIDDGTDLIFPSAICATDYFKKPLAEYYLYTSPHGGADIRLYLANSITGPWKLHGTVVDKRNGRANHVSSPHAVWNVQAKALLLYVHAPNDQTIYCRSTDGVHFEYGGVCVTTEMVSNVVGFKSKSASYARVYAHRIPEYGNSWTMTLTASGKPDKQGRQKNAIVLCTSDDGIQWTVRRTLVDDGDAGWTYKSLDACWMPLDGRNLLVYARRSRAEQGKKRTEPVRLHFSEGDENWRNWTYQGVFYNPLSGYPDDGAARGVSFFQADKQSFLLYEAGQKKNSRIGLLNLTKGPAPVVAQQERPDKPVSLDDLLKNFELETVYETSFENPLRVIRESELTEDGKFVREPPKDVDWVLEGPGKVRLESGRLHIQNSEGHTVLWNTREFPENFVAEWDFKHLHQQGLAIFFFAARGGEGGSVFTAGLPERNGVFRNYTKGKINCYHTSYFAISKEGVPRGETHLRKNKGANLVEEGPSTIDGSSSEPHRIRVAKLGPRIILEVDGEISFDWTDPGKKGVAPYRGGQIGLRQMKHIVEASYGYLKIQAVR